MVLKPSDLPEEASGSDGGERSRNGDAGRARPKRERNSRDRLSRDQWIAAAYRTLAEQGWAQVNIEKLAKRLGVTKGSFYWHFRDRGELVAALLEKWNEQLVIGRVEAAGGNAREKIHNLLDIVIKANRQARGGALELAMRAWARQDPEAAQVVEAVDQERIDYTARLFVELGFSKGEAEARAFLLYAYIFAQGVFTTKNERDLLERIHQQCCALIAGEAAPAEAGSA